MMSRHRRWRQQQHDAIAIVVLAMLVVLVACTSLNTAYALRLVHKSQHRKQHRNQLIDPPHRSSIPPPPPATISLHQMKAYMPAGWMHRQRTMLEHLTGMDIPADSADMDAIQQSRSTLTTPSTLVHAVVAVVDILFDGPWGVTSATEEGGVALQQQKQKQKHQHRGEKENEDDGRGGDSSVDSHSIFETEKPGYYPEEVRFDGDDENIEDSGRDSGRDSSASSIKSSPSSPSYSSSSQGLVELRCTAGDTYRKYYITPPLMPPVNTREDGDDDANAEELPLLKAGLLLAQDQSEEQNSTHHNAHRWRGAVVLVEEWDPHFLETVARTVSSDATTTSPPPPPPPSAATSTTSPLYDLGVTVDELIRDCWIHFVTPEEQISEHMRKQRRDDENDEKIATRWFIGVDDKIPLVFYNNTPSSVESLDRPPSTSISLSSFNNNKISSSSSSLYPPHLALEISKLVDEAVENKMISVRNDVIISRNGNNNDYNDDGSTSTTSINDDRISVDEKLERSLEEEEEEREEEEAEAAAAAATDEYHTQCVPVPFDGDGVLLETHAATRTGVRGIADMLPGMLQPILDGLLKPVTSLLGGIIGDMLGPMHSQTLGQTTSGNTQTEILKLLTPKLIESLSLAIPDPVVELVSDQATEMLQHELKTFLVEAITPRVTTTLTASLEKSLSTAVPDKVNRDVPSKIALHVTQGAARALTSALTHSLVPALTHTLTHSPMQDYYCYYCFHHKAYCSYCHYAPTQVFYGLYYAGFYSNYYGSYYARFFSKIPTADALQSPRILEPLSG